MSNNKPNTTNTKLLSFPKWLELNYCKTKKYSNPNIECWVEYSPLERRNKTEYLKEVLKLTKYKEYKEATLQEIKIEQMYVSFSKGYECSKNNWYEVDSLGVTCHPETEGIYSEYYTTKTPQQAKFQFKLDTDIPYKEIRTRRAPSHDLYVLSTPFVLFPIITQLTHAQIDKMLHASGNQIGKQIKNYRNRYQSAWDIDFESLINLGLATKFEDGNLNFYQLTSYGLNIVYSMLPTKARKRHYLTLKESIK